MDGRPCVFEKRDTVDPVPVHLHDAFSPSARECAFATEGAKLLTLDPVLCDHRPHPHSHAHTFTLVHLQSNALQRSLTNRWDTIRKVLPPSFSGKYDKERFSVFLRANLSYLGYVGMVVAAVLLLLVGATVSFDPPFLHLRARHHTAMSVGFAPPAALVALYPDREAPGNHRSQRQPLCLCSL